MDRVDVVIPCYNYGAFLPQCIRSVLDQEGVDVRALVIDDCSTDGSEEVGRALARDEPRRLEFRRHASNLGHIETYNEGLLHWADAEFVLLISADDLVAPGAFARATRALKRFPDAGMCYGRQVVFKDEPPTAACDAATEHQAAKISGREFVGIASCAGGNPVPTPTAIVRTELQREIGGYKRALPHTADLDMWLRFALRAPVVRLESVQAYKREHARNMGKQFAPGLLADFTQRRLAFESALRDGQEAMEDCESLLAQALRAIAGQAIWAAHGLFEQGHVEGSERLSRFGAELDPSVREDASWRHLHWKRLMGRHAWQVVDQLRRTTRRLSIGTGHQEG